MIAPVMLVALYCIEFSTSKSMMSTESSILTIYHVSMTIRHFIVSEGAWGMYKVADAYKKNVKENG